MKKHILIFTAMFLILAGTLVGCKKENTDSTVVDVETTEELTEVSTEASKETDTSDSATTSEATEEADEVESDTTDSSALETVEDTKPATTPESNDKPATTSKPSEEASHTHSWSNATCTSPKTCTCGATSGSKLGHNFGNNATCSRCGASNPNYKETHIHEYEMTVIKTVQETRAVSVYFPCICSCNIGWLSMDEMKEHQDNDIAYWCKSCGHCSMVIKDENGACKYCGGTEFWDSKCTGWANGSKKTPITGTSEYSVLQCSCGEILTENDKPGDRLFPTDGGYTYIIFYPDEASRAKYDIADNVFYSINY